MSVVIAKPYGSRGDVLFNNPEDPNGAYSNMTRTPITVNGLLYHTPEHYFQAMKYYGSRYAEVVRQAPTPSQARAAATCMGSLQYIRADWDECKEGVMMRAFVAKFTQHPKDADFLLTTVGQRLVYTRKDNYWGVGRDGKSGENRYGELLMRLREGLRKGAVPRTGLCNACGKADVWVATLSAAVFQYCSPGCRVVLKLPEELAKEELPPELVAVVDTPAGGEAAAAVAATSAAPAASPKGKTARPLAVAVAQAVVASGTPALSRSVSPVRSRTPMTPLAGASPARFGSPTKK